MGVKICHCIHPGMKTPLVGEKLRADCLHRRAELGKQNESLSKAYARNQIEVFVHRPEHDEVEVVTEIPGRGTKWATE